MCMYQRLYKYRCFTPKNIRRNARFGEFTQFTLSIILYGFVMHMFEICVVCFTLHNQLKTIINGIRVIISLNNYVCDIKEIIFKYFASIYYKV